MPSIKNNQGPTTSTHHDYDDDNDDHDDVDHHHEYDHDHVDHRVDHHHDRIDHYDHHPGVRGLPARHAAGRVLPAHVCELWRVREFAQLPVRRSVPESDGLPEQPVELQCYLAGSCKLPLWPGHHEPRRCADLHCLHSIGMKLEGVTGTQSLEDAHDLLD